MRIRNIALLAAIALADPAMAQAPAALPPAAIYVDPPRTPPTLPRL